MHPGYANFWAWKPYACICLTVCWSCVVISQRYLYFYLSGHQISELKNTDEGHTNTTRNGFHMSDVAMWWVPLHCPIFQLVINLHSDQYTSQQHSLVLTISFEVSGAFWLWILGRAHFTLPCHWSIFSYHSVTEYPSSIQCRLMFATCSVSMLLFMMLCFIILRHHLFCGLCLLPGTLLQQPTQYINCAIHGWNGGILNHMICLLMMNSKNKHEWINVMPSRMGKAWNHMYATKGGTRVMRVNVAYYTEF